MKEEIEKILKQAHTDFSIDALCIRPSEITETAHSLHRLFIEKQVEMLEYIFTKQYTYDTGSAIHYAVSPIDINTLIANLKKELEK